MTAPDPFADGAVEVARLAAMIADRILEQHAAGRTIAPVQFTMLVGAARMLLDNGAPWPPSVEQVLMEVAQRIAHAETTRKAAQSAPEGPSSCLSHKLFDAIARS